MRTSCRMVAALLVAVTCIAPSTRAATVDGGAPIEDEDPFKGLFCEEDGPVEVPVAALQVLQATARDFLTKWGGASGVEIQDEKAVVTSRVRKANRADWLGWRSRLRAPQLGVTLTIRETRPLVCYFSASARMQLQTKRFVDGRYLSQEEMERIMRAECALSMDEGQRRAEAFLTAVYPRFRERDFRLVDRRLNVRHITSYYLAWEELFDPRKPRAYPNRISIGINPKTGVIVSYSAEDISLPTGFRLGISIAEAIERTRQLNQRTLSRPDLKVVGQPRYSLSYWPPGSIRPDERFALRVSFPLRPRDPRDEGQEEYMYVSASCLFDAVTGEVLLPLRREGVRPKDR